MFLSGGICKGLAPSAWCGTTWQAILVEFANTLNPVQLHPLLNPASSPFFHWYWFLINQLHPKLYLSACFWRAQTLIDPYSVDSISSKTYFKVGVPLHCLSGQLSLQVCWSPAPLCCYPVPYHPMNFIMKFKPWFPYPLIPNVWSFYYITLFQ